MTVVLVVEDDTYLVRTMRIGLAAGGYHVVSSQDGAGALEAARAEPPDLVILDLGLPDMDGVEVIDALRAWCPAPIIVLSARHYEAAKVAALDAGADDYVTKPFGMPELFARIRAALRRARPADTGAAVVATAAFTVDLAGKRVVGHHGTDVRLTPTEWQLLEALARRPGALVAPEELVREVCGPGAEPDVNYLRGHLAELRRKLEPDPARPQSLITEPGAGYRLVLAARIATGPPYSE